MSSDQPTWKAMTFGSAAFLAVCVIGTCITARLLTGVWGDAPNHPLWVGPVSAAVGVVSAVASTVGYFAVRVLAETSPRAIRAACSHEGAVPVESAVTGDIIAALCPACDKQLERGQDYAGR